MQRKVKKEKEKEKRKENLVKKKEEEEKDRFLQLSDREKVGSENLVLIVFFSQCFRKCLSSWTGWIWNIFV